MRYPRRGTLLSLLGLSGLVSLALTACPTVDQGDVPPPPAACQPSMADFQDKIWPMAIDPPDKSKSCVNQAGCHTRETGRSALRLIQPPMAAGDWQMNYDVVTRFLNCNTPSASSFVTKPSAGGDPHAGGDLWPQDGEPTITVEQWIAGGS
jgi:hypothetical protein